MTRHDGLVLIIPLIFDLSLRRQVRDEYRMDYDPGRGGYGQMIRRSLGDKKKDAN